MPRPWSDPLVWKRGATLFGVTLLVSLGLCGLNYAAYHGITHHASVSNLSNLAQMFLTFTGIAEDLGILVGALGLLASLLGLLLSAVLRQPE